MLTVLRASKRPAVKRTRAWCQSLLAFLLPGWTVHAAAVGVPTGLSAGSVLYPHS